MSEQQRFDILNAKSLTEFVNVLIDTCHKMQLMLDTETKIIQSKTLVESLKKNLFMATEVIMKLFHRNRPIDDGTTEECQAIKLQKDLIDKIPAVESQLISFRLPIQYIIAARNFTFAYHPVHHSFFSSGSICRLLDVPFDYDATDHDGDTLLLSIARIMATLSFPKHMLRPGVEMLTSLIDQGAYIYARNSDGKTVIDYLERIVSKPEGQYMYPEVYGLWEMLKSKVPSLQSLAAMKAKGLNSTIDIPEPIQAFLELH